MSSERPLAGASSLWPEVSLQSVAKINPETLPAGTNPDFTFKYIDIGTVSAGRIDWQEVRELAFATAPSRARRVVKVGDVLLSTVRPGLQSHAFAGWSSEANYVASTGFAIVRPGEGLHPRFLYHLVFSDCISGQLRRLEVGTNYPAVNESDIKTLRIPCPPRSVQKAIAAALDAVDHMMTKTKVEVAKLKDIKAALMHSLLMRGLDENGQLRDPLAHPEQFQDSPLGMIPRQWEVVPIASLAVMITSGSRGWAKYYSDDGPLFLRIGNLTREHVNLRLDDLVNVRPPVGSEGSRTAVQPGDVLISITADLGIVGVVPHGLGEAYVNQHIALVRLDPKRSNPRWAANWLAGNRGQMQFYRLNDVGAKAGLNLPTVGALLVPNPDMPEQDRIAAIIDSQDACIQKEELTLSKLRQLKKGLMQDLLTGRVRV